MKCNKCLSVLNVNLRDNLNCIMKCEIRSKSVVALGKEDKKRKVFLHFYVS